MLRMALQDAIGSFDPLVKLLSLHGMVGVFSRDETGASVIAYEHSIGFDLSIDRSIDRSIDPSIHHRDRRTSYSFWTCKNNFKSCLGRDCAGSGSRCD